MLFSLSYFITLILSAFGEIQMEKHCSNKALPVINYTTKRINIWVCNWPRPWAKNYVISLTVLILLRTQYSYISHCWTSKRWSRNTICGSIDESPLISFVRVNKLNWDRWSIDVSNKKICIRHKCVCARRFESEPISLVCDWMTFRCFWNKTQVVSKKVLIIISAVRSAIFRIRAHKSTK